MKKFLIIIAVLAVGAFLAPTFAQTNCQGDTSSNNLYSRATGLISAPSLSGIFSNPTGQCIVDPKAGFAPFKIPGYDDLKSLYFIQSKLTKSTITSVPASFSADGLYQVTGDLIVSSNPTGTGTQLIFVGGNLNISQNYTYGSNQSGTVFIVKGNINVNPTVTRIDAVLISEGQFCSIIQSNGACKSSGTDQQLVINGSVISLSQDKPPIFDRSLADNSQPAELINHQVKYLVILRNLLSDTFQRWSEIP